MDIKKITKFTLLFMVISLVGTGILSAAEFTGVQAANTAWVMISSALVLLMVPGLAFFYAGMVRSKNVLNTLMLSFVALGVITIQWFVVGYSLAFGPDTGHFIGGLKHIFLNGISWDIGPKDNIPPLLFVAFQGMFAVITPALISGAIAERMKFLSYILFIVLWATLVYDPVCHWVWGEGGWIKSLGEFLGWKNAEGKALEALDFAGGTVVHINSGVSALAAVLILGKRKGFPNEVILPNNLTYTLLGAGLLWFGWFGFNAGSALAADSSATLAFVTTFIATGGGAVSWMLIEYFHVGKASALGLASGIVAGLVAITPAAAFVTPGWALVIGLGAGLACYGGIMLKGKLRYDDALDVLGIHGIGGTWGAIATGIFATVGAKGLIAGGFHQFIIQIIAVVGTVVYAFVVTYVILIVIDKIMGLRVSETEEDMGLDTTQHGETGYNI